MPQPPKLRSSCDGCGAAKVRCDRGQPACRRCISLDQACFYGVSRKTGKPPRSRLSVPELRVGSIHDEQARGGGNATHQKSHTYGQDHGDLGNDSMVQGSEAILNDQALNLHTTLTTPATTLNHLYWPELDSMDFEDPLLHHREARTGFAQAAVEAEGSATPASQPYTSHPPLDSSADIDHALLQPASGQEHDCFQEGYDILGSLSYHRINSTHSTAESSPSDLSTTATAGSSRVPLDHVLGVNREACKGLGRILACSCAKTPQLTLLCASIISQILMWYQQAAGSTQGQWCDPVDKMPRMTITSQARSLSGISSGSGFGSWTGSSTWSSAASSVTGSRAASIHHVDGAELAQVPMPRTRLVGPAKMAIGNFSIDDLRMQTALQIHLLLDEMKRVGRVINQFALHDFDDHAVTNDYTAGGAHSLYEILDTWLRSEHARMVNMTKARLTDLHS